MRLILAAILLLSSAVASAQDRNLLFLQHLLPGHIEYVSVVELGDGAVVRAEGMGKSTLRRNAVASASEFAELWNLANSPGLAIYNIPSGDDGNMSDPDFFTVAVGDGTGPNFYLKIPVEGHNESAETFVIQFQKYIRK